MPISPTVSAWMAQGAQQPADDQDSLFRKSFSDSAFNSLRAKAPAVIPYVTTFKTFDFSVDDGDAFGTFILSYGGTDLLFIPIVMFGGSITSCEMAYIRAEDRFVPLSDDFIRKIVDKNNATMATPLNGPVKVEDTRQMFRNIVRPPMSSNVVFASSRMDISELPNEAKRQMSDYLRSHPALLGKIAEFYPVEVLAERLSQRQTKTASVPSEGPMLLKLAEITAEAVACLGEFDRATLLRRGWLLKNAETETAHVAAPAEFGSETMVRLSEHGKGDIARNEIRRAKVVRFDGGKFKKDDALIVNASGCRCNECGCPGESSSYIMLKDGTSVTFMDRIVLEDSRSADEDDLKEFGFVGVSELRSKLKDGGSLLVVVPRKNGDWSTACRHSIFGDRMSVVSDDGGYVVREGDTKLVEVTGAIKHGSIRGSVVPKNALFKVVRPGFGGTLPGIVNTLQGFFDIIRSHGVVLRVADSSGVTEITDTNTQKTASFADKGDAAKWLNMEYGMSERQICETLARPETMVLSKFADEYMSGYEPGLQGEVPMQPQQPQPQLNPQGTANVQVPQFSPNDMNSFVAMEDPDMVDVGILSSFAGNQDVKTLLVEYIPDFVNVLDRIGRIILLFCLQRRELEQYYRVDKINELLQNCRKVFRIVGDLVQSLQVYVNMA